MSGNGILTSAVAAPVWQRASRWQPDIGRCPCSPGDSLGMANSIGRGGQADWEVSTRSTCVQIHLDGANRRGDATRKV